MLLAVFGLMGLALLCVCSQGCGGSAPTVAAKPPSPALDKSGKPKPVWNNDDCPPPKDWGQETPAKPPPALVVKPLSAPVKAPPADDEGTPRAQKVKRPARPKEVADWKRDDYYSARKENDPRLVAAVGYLGEHFAGKQSAAELLIRLLAGPPTSTDPDDDGPRGPSANLVQAIVAALAVNGTPLARQTIDQLASGNSNTSDNRGAGAAALKMLLGRPGQENEDSLLRVVVLAGQPQPADRDSALWNGQHRILLDLLKSSASATLRMRLANYMIAPETPQTWYDQLWTCLQEPRPENLAAQSVLYRSDRPDPAAKRLLEQRLIVGSSAAVGRLLGTISTTERQPAAGMMAAADPYAVAEQIWNPTFASVIERRLAVIDTLEQGTRLLLLASTIPGERVRAAVLRTFKMHWEEDPKSLEAARAAEKANADPGFLVLAKILPRKDPAAFAGGNGGSDHGGAAHTPAGKGAKTPKTAKVAALREAKQQREHITQQWGRFAENVLRTMCRQFCEAAGAPGESRGSAGAGRDANDMPLKLHSPTDVVAAYRADWPEGLSGKPVGLALSPLRVRYVRIEQQARPLKVVAYYRRQLPDCEEHRIEQGVWLDALSPTSEGSTRSIDVLITRANKNLPSLADQDQRLIVEVLAIECGGIVAKSPLAIGK
jgi:hypothetical protein